ncbi:B2 protein-like [Phoenix dactylifera]|uniref:B2 protein-like n=1 Tax=Phoenix dactylifera TaxID=42345 RepID=A0A8B7CU78_PHODC|nr:B2 protein-like [Phoenix dactylifera]
MEASNQEFWHFSDQIRLQTIDLSNLSIGDSIWSDSYLKRTDERRNFENPVGPSDLGWKMGFGNQKLAFGNSNNQRINNSNSNDNSGGNNGGMKNGNFATNGYNSNNNNNNTNGVIKNYFSKGTGKSVNHGHGGKKNNGYDGNGGSGKKKNNNNGNSGSNNNNSNGAVDKRFKTLPPSESLPRNEAVGGYIFVCNNDTMEENLRRQLFGLPSRYRDSVRAITPGLPLFLYNYSTHQLHGIFEAASFGGTNIDPTAWGDKKCPGESRFPAQVRVMTRKVCDPLEEDSFRPILHHYDGPKFRLELSVPEALSLLDIFAVNNA